MKLILATRRRNGRRAPLFVSSVEVADEFAWVQADSVRHVQELHHIDPTLATLYAGDVSLSSAKLVG